MLKNFKSLIVVFIILCCSNTSYTQTKSNFKDVTLNGKPAKLNMATGEITLPDASGSDTGNKTGVETIIAKSEAIKANDSTKYHIVIEGETLLDISKRYNISLRSLKDANNLETTLINEGQTLRVSNAATDSNEVMPLKKDIEIQPHEIPETSSYFHVVVKGETLYSLANKYHLDINELKRISNLKSNLIKIGQKIHLKKTKEGVNNSKGTFWTVSKGDTLYSIAKKNHTTVAAIKRLNGLKSNLIKIGDKLLIN